jgi:hypothetical protein
MKYGRLAEIHHSVVGHEDRQTAKQRIQRREIRVDIADREGPTSHSIIVV